MISHTHTQCRQLHPNYEKLWPTLLSPFYCPPALVPTKSRFSGKLAVAGAQFVNHSLLSESRKAARGPSGGRGQLQDRQGFLSLHWTGMSHSHRISAQPGGKPIAIISFPVPDPSQSTAFRGLSPRLHPGHAGRGLPCKRLS